jgi:hypothetical protein
MSISHSISSSSPQHHGRNFTMLSFIIASFSIIASFFPV